MTFIEYLKEAVEAALDKMYEEYGGSELWKYFREAFDAMIESLDEDTLNELVMTWYRKQATTKGLEKKAVENTIKRLAENLWSAISTVYSIPEANLDRVDFKAIDWKSLLQSGASSTDIAKEIARHAGVSPEAVEKQIEEYIQYTEQLFSQTIDELKKLLRTAKELDPVLYEYLVKKLEKLLPKVEKSVEEADKEVEQGALGAFIAAATELIKSSKELVETFKKVVEEFKKTSEEIRKAVEEMKNVAPAQAPAPKPETEKKISIKPVPVGENAEEQKYLMKIVEKWKWGYNPDTAEFLAPLTVVWVILTKMYDMYPDLLEAAKLWVALNRYVWSRAVDFKAEFLEVEKNGRWGLILSDVAKLIERRNPELAYILTTIAAREDVPTDIVYSLADNKLYEFRWTVFGPELVKEIKVEELSDIITKRVAWLEKKVVETPGTRGKTIVDVPKPERLLVILGGRCPVCGSTKLDTMQIYGPGTSPSANCAVVTCYNCHTVYRLYGDGRKVIAPPTLDPVKWKERWEKNPAKDPNHPFSEQWIKKVEEFAKTHGFTIEPQS
jgi:hypothetical protein